VRAQQQVFVPQRLDLQLLAVLMQNRREPRAERQKLIWLILSQRFPSSPFTFAIALESAAQPIAAVFIGFLKTGRQERVELRAEGRELMRLALRALAIGFRS
jgi:hypothetical protein